MGIKPVRMYVCVSSITILPHDHMLWVTAADDPGPVNVTVCASGFSDCCGIFTDTIQVKFCPGTGDDSDFYVYQLKNVPFCDMAYCAIKGMHFSAVLTLHYHLGEQPL